ncbi:DUF3784 domain-containing protein [Trueperella sp. zg.1013]|nr:DUF3784 domain-containing protein [Trueperella sp. zg.1013]
MENTNIKDLVSMTIVNEIDGYSKIHLNIKKEELTAYEKSIVLLVTIPLLIGDILILIGKGRFLIAGYNTLSESKKKQA